MNQVLSVMLALSIFTGSPEGARANPDSTKAERFVRESVARSMILFEESESHSVVARRIRGELKENFDVTSIAAYALGPLRTDLSADQKRRYLDQFRAWMSETVTRFAVGLRDELQTVSPAILNLTGTTPVGADQILVHSQLRQSNGTRIKVDWRLRLKGSRFLVLDIITAGVSQAELFRSQMSSLIRRENRDIEGVIAALKQKNTDLVIE